MLSKSNLNNLYQIGGRFSILKLKFMLNLRKLEESLDNSLNNETPESLTNWLNKQRNTMDNTNKQSETDIMDWYMKWKLADNNATFSFDSYTIIELNKEEVLKLSEELKLIANQMEG